MSEIRNVKLFHVGKTYDLEIDLNGTIEELNFQIYSLTDIPPENQKLLGFIKGAVLNKDVTLKTLKITNGQKIIVVGQQGEVIKKDQTPILSSPNTINSTTNNNINNSMIKEDCNKLIWQEECNRIYLNGLKINQPIYKNLKNGNLICFACFNTCHQGDKQYIGDMDFSTQFECQCSNNADECLYKVRIGTVELTDTSKKNLLESLKFTQERMYKKTPTIAPVSLFNNNSEISNIVDRNHQRMRIYEDKILQGKALSLIPKSILFNRKNEKIQPGEAQIRDLLHWFKNDFFKWVDSPACVSCTSPTNNVGHGQPNREESNGGASRVELYQCNFLHVTRFPRYNNPEKLLQTRCGRCGEWANAFTLVCLALGYKTRYILDLTDHVWNEIYLNGKWNHIDSCEASFDAPLTYESGWGKKLNYVFAFERDGAFDVTKRYTTNFIQLQRNKFNESQLESYLDSYNSQIQNRLSVTDLLELKERLESERLELLESQSRKPKSEDLTSRVSGSEAWKQSRGEDGSSIIKDDYNQPILSQSLIINQLLYKYQDNNQSSIHILGSCKAVNGGIIQLTPNEVDKVGGFYLKNPIDLVSKSWVCKFGFKIDRGGADGMAFVIQNHDLNKLGNGGSGIGYEGIENSIAVEFDTYSSVDRCNDPNGNHVSVHTNGTNKNSSHHRYSLACVSPQRQLNDGSEHNCTIDYDCQNEKLSIWLDGFTLIQNLKIQLSSKLELQNDTSAWIGLVAATGGLKQSHIINYFEFGYK